MADQRDRSPIAILAPLSGELVPLEQVPDPVFAQKMVGDGIAIDPTDQILRAPCSGEVAQLHPAGHAVTVQMINGVQVLMHIGLDTVNLKGRGFTPKVKQGDQVSAGTALIEFDMDFVAVNAKSLLTLVVVTTPDRIHSLSHASGMVTAGQNTIFTLVPKDVAELTGNIAEQRVTSEAILIPNPSGLHARPAAVLANVAKFFRSEIRLHLGEKQANAKSVTSIMALDARLGAKIILTAQGVDATEAIAKLTGLLQQGLGDKGHKPAPAPASITKSAGAASAPHDQPQDPNLLFGVAASPGLGVGHVFQMRRVEIVVTEEADHPDQERRLLDAALEKAEAQLGALQAQLRAGNDPAKAAIFAAHTELLEDPDLLEIAISSIAKGKSAAFAWQSAFQTHAERLAGMQNELLAQRANDLRDVGERVLELISGIGPGQPAIYPAETVLIGEDLTPSDTALLDRTRVIGFCTTRGGATSHVAILARSLGIPALAGVEPRALDVSDGTPVILDGGRGILRLHPSAAEMEHIRGRQKAAEVKREEDLAHAREPATTLDGHRLEVVANINGLRDAERIESLGGEGVGLLRSEFLFMERSSAPTEDEQFESYKAIAQAVGPDKPLIIRTLDVGGDKPLAYLPIPTEDNPFLGERGIRVALDRPEILRTQLRAILRASAFGKIQILLPMIATLGELRDAKAILSEECARLSVPQVPVGIMVEIPSAAVMAPQFAKEADFLSIGSNDLTQYTLAMDRGHPKLAPQVDGLNPAVLRLISLSVAGAHSGGRRIGVCGGIAGDAHAVPLLVGLGVDELSVSLPAIPAVKAQVRGLRLTICRQLAQEALNCDTGVEVRALVAKATSANP